jgi:hypothetical protein
VEACEAAQLVAALGPVPHQEPYAHVPRHQHVWERAKRRSSSREAPGGDHDAAGVVAVAAAQVAGVEGATESPSLSGGGEGEVGREAVLVVSLVIAVMIACAAACSEGPPSSSR